MSWRLGLGVDTQDFDEKFWGRPVIMSLKI